MRSAAASPDGAAFASAFGVDGAPDAGGAAGAAGLPKSTFGAALTAASFSTVKLGFTYALTAGGQITVNQDVQNDPLLILYVKARATWQRQEWPKHFGAESTVRHSLPEETDSLRAIAVLTGAAPTADREKFKPWADTLAAIQTLSNAGLLEACVLLEHADDGVILDYAAYREQNRPLLLRYLREYALGPVPAASAPSK